MSYDQRKVTRRSTLRATTASERKDSTTVIEGCAPSYHSTTTAVRSYSSSVARASYYPTAVCAFNVVLRLARIPTY